MEEKIKKVVEKHRQLLQWEEAAEEEEQQYCLAYLTKQQLQRRGLALYGLKLEEQRTGMGGKCIITLKPFNSSDADPHLFPAHTIRVGDVVQVDLGKRSTEKKSAHDSSKKPTLLTTPICQGVVSKVTDNTIVIVLRQDIPSEWDNIPLRVVKLANDITFRRMYLALDRLEAQSSRVTGLLESIFGRDTSSSIVANQPEEISIVHNDAYFYNPNLNEPQRLAVYKAVKAPYLALIHGPPGTGKTETLTEIVRQLVKPKLDHYTKDHSPALGNHRYRILVCGPSNLSVDNVLGRLVQETRDPLDVEMIRVGHPARVLDSLQRHTLDMRLASHEASSLLRDIRNEIDAAVRSLSKPGSKNKREIYTELKTLRQELRERERGLVDSLLGGLSVVLSTLSMCGSTMLDKRPFDVVVIDEAGQALESECWLAMVKAEKVILAGDHCQLPPTVTSERAKQGGLEVTLFERLIGYYFNQTSSSPILCPLTIQYRMNEVICQWTSEEFYKSKLVPHSQVSHHRLCDLPGVQETEETQTVMQFIDTAGLEYRERVEEEEKEEEKERRDDDKSREKDKGKYKGLSRQVDQLSKYNKEEAQLTVEHVATLIEAGVKDSDIAIITPYNAQVALLKSLVAERGWTELEIGSGKIDS